VVKNYSYSSNVDGMVETFYSHFVFKKKIGRWSINLPFLCNQCGVCCKLDDFLIAGKVKINPEKDRWLLTQLTSLYEDLGRRWETNEVQYDHYIMNEYCPFLKEKKCTIYSSRPEGCRQFPYTMFGFLTRDCEALNRFKKQMATLSRGRKANKSFHFTTAPLKKSNFSDKQFAECVSKLRKVGVTDEELILFSRVNQRS
jgi:Fe-S-cluster containining protein